MSRRLREKIFFLIFNIIIFFFIILPRETFAQEIQTDYEVNYLINQIRDKFEVGVNYKIKITNLKSDIILSKFFINFPKEFKINNLNATYNNIKLDPRFIFNDNELKIEFDLSYSKVGRGEENILVLNFNQENLLKKYGGIWELMIPNIKNDNGVNKILVSIPNLEERKISLAKPLPNTIKNNSGRTEIYWFNPKEKLIYTIFGDRQYYQLDLVYNLKNNKPYPIFTEIAFPPDTFYQKIYVKNIQPKLSDYYSDDDGNFIGKVFLYPKEEKKIYFSGIVELSIKPRQEVKEAIEKLISNQKKYLLSSDGKFWSVNNLAPFTNLKTPKDIYDFVITKLEYNFQKIEKRTHRLGAEKVLQRPDYAVCTEFTDLFIALAREKGIYSREIQGYGFSHEIYLRPISSMDDVLHSWVEYFDLERKIWIPIDPTWEKTSGIDYFNSMDLNHIAFVIHGKNPDYPLPAGMYKIENSKDILINVVEEPIKERQDLVVNFGSFPKLVYSNKNYKTKLKITNKSNTYLWNINLNLIGSNIELKKNNIYIPYLVPFTTQNFEIVFLTNNKILAKNGLLVVNYLNQQEKKEFSILPFYFLYFKYIIIVLLFLIVLLIILKNGIFNKKR